MKEAELIQRASQGDVQAFEQMVRNYRGLVYAICIDEANDFDDAQDLVQEVFIKVYQDLPSLRDANKFVGWLRTVAKNVCRMEFRRKRSKTALKEDEMPTSSISTQKQPELQILLSSALDSISKTNRSVLMLHYFGGYSYEEMSQLLGVPQQTIKSRLYEGRKQLKEKLLKVVEELLRLRLPSEEMVHQVISHCKSKGCSCAQELMQN